MAPGSRVTIAFDDPTVPCFAPVWEPAIKLVIAELEKGGVKRSNITLVSAGHIIVAGPENSSLVNHVGFEPARTVEAAIDMARERHGKDASVAFVKYPLLACRE